MSTHMKAHVKSNKSNVMVFRNETDNQFYGKIESGFGSGRFAVALYDSLEQAPVNARARGSIYKQRLNKGDYVLVCSDGLGSNNYYIMMKYSPDQAKQLIKGGHLTERTVQTVDEEKDTQVTFIDDKPAEEGGATASQSLDDFIDDI